MIPQHSITQVPRSEFVANDGTVTECMKGIAVGNEFKLVLASIFNLELNKIFRYIKLLSKTGTGHDHVFSYRCSSKVPSLNFTKCIQALTLAMFSQEQEHSVLKKKKFVQSANAHYYL